MTDTAKYLEYIDKYCERTAEGVWVEPLNVISNIVFLIVSLLLLKYYRQNFQGKYLKNWDISLLIILLFCITFGSTLWHIFAMRWALYTDVIPILIFINLFLISCFVRVLRLGVISVIALFSLYQVFNYLVQSQFSIETLNGSIFYLPVLICLVGIMLYVLKKQNYLSRYYVIAVGLFSLALVLRTFDLSQCESFPVGTHFLWHTFIATMLYFLTMSLMQVSFGTSCQSNSYQKRSGPNNLSQKNLSVNNLSQKNLSPRNKGMDI